MIALRGLAEVLAHHQKNLPSKKRQPAGSKLGGARARDGAADPNCNNRGAGGGASFCLLGGEAPPRTAVRHSLLRHSLWAVSRPERARVETPTALATASSSSGIAPSPPPGPQPRIREIKVPDSGCNLSDDCPPRPRGGTGSPPKKTTFKENKAGSRLGARRCA